MKTIYLFFKFKFKNFTVFQFKEIEKIRSMTKKKINLKFEPCCNKNDFASFKFFS